MTYAPVFDGIHWHAAYLLPGVTDAYSSIVECPDERTAANTCAELERAAKRTRKELATDALLRGMRVKGRHG